MSISTLGVSTLLEQLDARQWSASESGGDVLSTAFTCRSSSVHTFRAQLVASGHPSYPAMRCKAEDVQAAETFTGVSRINATFNGVRSASVFSATTTAPARITKARPINTAQLEYEIKTLQNYKPSLNGPTTILLAEIPNDSRTYTRAQDGLSMATRYDLYPVIEQVEFLQLASDLYDCTYYVTTREAMCTLVNNGSGLTCPTGYVTSFTYVVGGRGVTPDQSVYVQNLPTSSITLTELTMGNGLDKLAAQRGKLIQTGYVRTTSQGQYSVGFVVGVSASLLPRYFPDGPPRILWEADLRESVVDDNAITYIT